MKFHDVEQNTDDWFQLRVGKKTASGISKIMANYGKAFGEPAKKYAAQLALEEITGLTASSGSYTNEHMERGHEQEPIARAKYEDRFFVDVTNGGFFDLGDRGCSPDGLVNDDGLIEIKSVIATTHYNCIKKQSFDSAYKWQLLTNLLFTGRDWIDFVSYCSEYPEENQLFIYRLNKEDYTEDFSKIEKRLTEFNDLIAECKRTIIKSSYTIGVAA